MHQVHFESETDTEVIAQLVTHYMTQGDDAQTAANKTFDRLEGAYSLALIFAGEDNLMIGTSGDTIGVGYGDGEMYLASDLYALAPLTNKHVFEDGDRVRLTRTDVQIYNATNDNVERPVRASAQSGAVTRKRRISAFYAQRNL